MKTLILRPAPVQGLFIRNSLLKFIANPANPYPLAVLRIAISVIGLVQLIIISPYLLQLYGNFGFIQWAISESPTDTWLPSLGKLCLLLYPLGVSYKFCVYAVFTIYGLGLCGLLVGWQTRKAAILAWLMHGLTVNSGYFSLYGVDTMLHICLFYAVWMPVGKSFSLDRYLSKKTVNPSFIANLSIRVLQIHLCIIYLDAGISKMQGVQWWNGEAIWRAMMQPQFSVFDISWLAQWPWLAMLICWGTLVIEFGYPFMVWPAKTRTLWVILTLMLHLGIGVFMGLWLFALIMMVLTFSAFGYNILAGYLKLPY
ncbi:HTTM domain-containing protein [Dyadobacter sp. NIV53]|uniref:HTTM domain-containing protein n=1 Tax=Dyadobacter sp. NIV53 TaxID=2861765 RepID=UPI001C878AA8|nr:HTTM domain-containing protein [Dyadobacter sp. NIV53]